jgi:hypothetical protein
MSMVAAGGAVAQSPKPCTEPQVTEFDFWIGDWDVYRADGKLAGTNRIARIYGCVLHEAWTTPSGGGGQSFSRFDPKRGVWHQTWVDSYGTLLLIEGGLRDGAMVLTDASGNEISWRKQADGTVRQHWRATKDGGKTWATIFDGKYVRSGRPQPE